MLKGHGQFGVTSSSKKPIARGRDNSRRMGVMASMNPEKKRMQATANTQVGGGGANISSRAFHMNFELGAMEGIIPHGKKAQTRVCRDIYEFDSVSGAAVDLMSNLPFSGFNLSGINDRKILGTYVKSIENLRMATLFPYMSRDFLVDGAFCATLGFDSNRGIFNNLITVSYTHLTLPTIYSV